MRISVLLLCVFLLGGVAVNAEPLNNKPETTANEVWEIFGLKLVLEFSSLSPEGFNFLEELIVVCRLSVKDELDLAKRGQCDIAVERYELKYDSIGALGVASIVSFAHVLSSNADFLAALEAKSGKYTSKPHQARQSAMEYMDVLKRAYREALQKR
jgi:hypothetical protein